MYREQALPTISRVAGSDTSAAHDALCAQGLGGTLAGRFQLRTLLGSGASGVVFEALDLKVGQHVALKLLRWPHPAALHQLKREFRALATIEHPNLVAMHELFVDSERRAFFTMELVRGRTFLEYVRADANSCDETRLRACLVQLARGVGHLHACGQLHRDLKPSNVLVSAAGVVSVVDFGLVRSLREPSAALEAFEGTPAYAGPEQRDPAGACCASDWYAVGVMLYEALTGVRPLEGNACELLAQKASLVPVRPSERTGLSMDRALEDLCMQLLEPDPRRRANDKALLKVLDPEPSTPDEQDWPFLGREHELQQLRAAYERSLTGEPSALVLRGASGMGKTTLAQHFVSSLRERALVLRARCFVQEALPFNALDGIIDALTTHLRGLPDSDVAALLPSDANTLKQVFPVLHRIPSLAQHEPEATALDPRDLRVLAWSALRELLQRLAVRAPVVLFIDDIHWADRDSARLLQALLCPPLRAVWLLATFRSDCGAHVLAEHGLEARLSWLELGPLPAHTVEALALRVIGPADRGRLDDITHASAGHPLVVRELVRHAAEQPGGNLGERVAIEVALQARLAQLTAAARALLELVCVAGQRVPCKLLFEARVGASLAVLRELRLRCAVRESLLDGQLQLEPYHDSIRQVVSTQLDEKRRQELHGVLADSMLALGDAYLERVVQHYVLAGRPRAAADLAERAARLATQQLAFHRAASLVELALEQAASENERQRLLVEAAQACDRAGRSLSAARHYEQAAQSAHTSGAELRLRALIAYSVSGHASGAREQLSLLAAELDAPLDLGSVSRVRVLASFAILLATGAPFLHKVPAKQQAARSHDSVTLRLLWRAAPSLLVTEPWLACLFAARALALAARQGERTVYGQALSFHLGLFSFILGRSSWLVDKHFARAERLVDSSEAPWERSFVRVMRAGAALLCCEPQRALELTLPIAISRDLPSQSAAVLRTCARGTVLPALYALGRVRRLAELAEAWLDEALDSGDLHMQVALRVLGAHRHLRGGDSTRALSELEVANTIQLDYMHPALLDPWWEASVYLYADRPESALAVCTRQREHFDHYAAHSIPTRVEWCAIEGTCAAGLAAKGLQRQRALQLLERCTRSAQRAVSHNAPPIAAELAASLHLSRGDRARAQQLLVRAIELHDARQGRLRAASLRLALARLDTRRHGQHERLALTVFKEEAIADPLRWANMLAPGLF